MIEENRAAQERVRTETSRGYYLLEVFGILCFMLLIALIAAEVYGGMADFGDLWLVPILTVIAYLAADFSCGFVHFLADNFGSYDTPILGPTFIEPFREHHVDPKGIVGHDFVDANGNNSLVSLPFMLAVWAFVPLGTTYYGYLFGLFFIFFCLAAFLTNQFHKWAHMDTPPAIVGWLQARGVILSKEHHDIHHQSPYDTYYCITAGFWNPLLDSIRFYERTERRIRRSVPGTEPMLRSEREGNLNG
jgi:sterol desaturase/sphingolipid hydroxylase (fatty acid hydroxylase superfamily)